jgi:hypothetical protein
MNCGSFENLWIDYFDEALDPAAHRQAEEHLSLCPRCAALVAEMRANRLLAGAIPEVEPPPQLIRKIIAETSGAPPAPAWYDFIFDFVRPQQFPKLAMGSLMAVASIVVVLYALGVDFRSTTMADLSPQRLWERTNREVHLAYSRGVKYYNALRIVYEIQSRFESLNASTEDQNQRSPSDPQKDSTPTPSTKPSSQHSVSQELTGAEFVVQNWVRFEDQGGLS